MRFHGHCESWRPKTEYNFPTGFYGLQLIHLQNPSLDSIHSSASSITLDWSRYFNYERQLEHRTPRVSDQLPFAFRPVIRCWVVTPPLLLRYPIRPSGYPSASRTTRRYQPRSGHLWPLEPRPMLVQRSRHPHRKLLGAGLAVSGSQ